MTPREFFLRENLPHPPLDKVEHVIFNAPSHLEAVRALMALFRDHRVSVPEGELGDLYLETVDTVMLRQGIFSVLKNQGIIITPAEVNDFLYAAHQAYLGQDTSILQGVIKRYSMFPVTAVEAAVEAAAVQIMERMALADKGVDKDKWTDKQPEPPKVTFVDPYLKKIEPPAPGFTPIFTLSQAGEEKQPDLAAMEQVLRNFNVELPEGKDLTCFLWAVKETLENQNDPNAALKNLFNAWNIDRPVSWGHLLFHLFLHIKKVNPDVLLEEPDSADSRVDSADSSVDLDIEAIREVLMHAIYITPKDAKVMPYLFQLRKLLGDEP